MGSLKSNIACRFVLGFLLLVPLTVMADNSDLYDTLCAGRRKALYGIYAYHMLHFDSSGAQDASAASALERGSVVSGIAGSLCASNGRVRYAKLPGPAIVIQAVQMCKEHMNALEIVFETEDQAENQALCPGVKDIYQCKMKALLDPDKLAIYKEISNQYLDRKTQHLHDWAYCVARVPGVESLREISSSEEAREISEWARARAKEMLRD